MSTVGRLLRLTSVLLVLVVTAGVATLAATTTAAAATGDGSTGYVRIAHLSPDTTTLDLTIARSTDATVVDTQQGLGYGTVTDYVALPPGRYSVDLIPGGSAPTTAPVVTGGLDLAAGEVLTVAIIGTNAQLQNVVLEDDLSSPAPGSARVRAVHAAALAGPITATMGGGEKLLDNASLGDAGPYTDVAPGASNLSLVEGNTEDVVDLDLSAGTVHTVFVVGNAQGALRVIPVLDAVAVAEPPTGGVATGGGALAESQRMDQFSTALGLAALAALTAAVIVLRVRHVRNGGRPRS